MSSVWENFPHGGSKKLVMLAMADWCNDDGGSLYPANATVAHKCCITKSQAVRILRDLCIEGWLQVVGNHSGGDPAATKRYLLNVSKLTSTHSANATGSTNATGSAHATPPIAPVLPLPIASTLLTHSTHATQYISEPSGKPKPIQAYACKASPEKTAIPNCPFEEIISTYHAELPELPQYRVRTEKRDGVMRQRWRQFYASGDFKTSEEGIECFRWYFKEKVKPSKFLTGRINGKDRPFLADLEWLMLPSNFAKVLEGKYS